MLTAVDHTGCVVLVVSCPVEVLEHFTWGGKGVARGLGRGAWEDG